MIACKQIECSSSLCKIFQRMSTLLLILSNPGISRIRNLTYYPPTSKADPSQKFTSVVTYLRLLATLIAGLLVSNFVVALFPDPERPIISTLQTWSACIVLKLSVFDYKLSNYHKYRKRSSDAQLRFMISDLRPNNSCLWHSREIEGERCDLGREIDRNYELLIYHKFWPTYNQQRTLQFIYNSSNEQRKQQTVCQPIQQRQR